MMAEKTIRLLPPHSGKQRTLITHPGNVVSLCGRRWGKTDANTQRIFYWMEKNNGLYWWVGLSWKSASMKRAWRNITEIGRAVLREMGLDERMHINRSRYEVILPGLGEVWFRTADNPPSLAGEGIQGAVIDEFSLMPEIVWTEYLQATLLDYKGWASFAGVPKGKNWAARLFWGAAEWDGWQQIHATTYDNPFIDSDEIDKVKETTPASIFDQEYLAVINENEGAVFRNIAACMNAPQTTPEDHEGHNIVIGVDWGKQADFTAISVGCTNCRCEVDKDRFNQIDYAFQRGRLENIAKKWKAYSILAESNAMGEPIIEELQRAGLPVTGFQTTATSKPPLIENLALTLEREEWQFMNDPIWTAELEAYERKVSPVTGRNQYSAPEGMHDDTVIARALMLQVANHPHGAGLIAFV